MSWGDRPTTSAQGKVLSPTQGALLTTLVLMLKEQGVTLDVDELYLRAMASDQGLIDSGSL